MHTVAAPHPVSTAATTRYLEETSTLARLLGDHVCESGEGSCQALHGIWPDLRLLGLAAGPDRHIDFFTSAIGECASHRDATRVLIAGCADWGMLATVATIYSTHTRELEVTVIDRCATPLLLCAWYGAQIALPVRTIVADLITHCEPEQYDLICTHSLLTYPTDAAREQLVANWFRMLRPGGAVVTVTRLQPTPTIAASARQRAQQFGDLVLERYRGSGLQRDELDLRARAERFALAQAGHPIADAHTLQSLFETRGFTISRLEMREIGSPNNAVEPVMGAARSGIYAEIISIKKAQQRRTHG